MWIVNQTPFYAGKFISIYFLGFSLKRVAFFSKIYSNLNLYCLVLILSVQKSLLVLAALSLSILINPTLPSMPVSV